MTSLLDQAFDLANQVDPHLTGPNPRVGCVVVDKQNNIIAQGAHQIYGECHAEAEALHTLAAQKYPNWNTRDTHKLFTVEPLLKDKTVYITLEPCDCFGGKKTASCVDLLIHHQPHRVIIGAIDPMFGGTSIQKLESAGINVIIKNSLDKHKALNPFFPSHQKPYICLKLALTLDGKINLDQTSYPNGKSYISNATSRQFVQALRAKYTSILTTTKTVLMDNPRLTCRLDHFFRSYSDPDIIIVGENKIPLKSQIFSIKSSRTIHRFPRQSLATTLIQCRKKLNIDSILVEAGAHLSTELLANNLVDEIIIFICPSIAGRGLAGFNQSLNLEAFNYVETHNLNGDIALKYIKSIKKK